MTTTYKLIAKTTLATTTNAVTFANIPQSGYSDLAILCSARTSNAAIYDGMRLEFNGSSSNLSSLYFGASGSSTYASTTTNGYVGSICGANAPTGAFGNTNIYITNYAENSYKTFSSTSTMENSSTTSYLDLVAGLWLSTAAITQLTIIRQNNNFVSGSSFYLYGIQKA